jgi:hypothetical protein
VSGIARRANFSFASRNSFLSHEACRLTAAAQNGDRARLTGAALHALAQVRQRLPGAACTHRHRSGTVAGDGRPGSGDAR